MMQERLADDGAYLQWLTAQRVASSLSPAMKARLVASMRADTGDDVPPTWATDLPTPAALRKAELLIQVAELRRRLAALG